MQLLREHHQTCSAVFLQCTVLIPPLIQMVMEYNPEPSVRYLFVIEETIPSPSSRADKAVLDAYHRTPQHLCAPWDPFPHHKRIEYTSLWTDHRFDRSAPQLGPMAGRWFKPTDVTLRKSTLLCRKCIFCVTDPNQMHCPWLFDEDLFGSINVDRYDQIYCEFTYNRERTKRRDVRLPLKNQPCTTAKPRYNDLKDRTSHRPLRVSIEKWKNSARAFKDFLESEEYVRTPHAIRIDIYKEILPSLSKGVLQEIRRIFVPSE